MRYWLLTGKRRSGPFSPEEVVRAEGFAPESLVCPEAKPRKNRRNWKSAKRFKDLSEAMARRAAEPSGAAAFTAPSMPELFEAETAAAQRDASWAQAPAPARSAGKTAPGRRTPEPPPPARPEELVETIAADAREPGAAGWAAELPAVSPTRREPAWIEENWWVVAACVMVPGFLALLAVGRQPPEKLAELTTSLGRGVVASEVETAAVRGRLAGLYLPPRERTLEAEMGEGARWRVWRLSSSYFKVEVESLRAHPLTGERYLCRLLYDPAAGVVEGRNELARFLLGQRFVRSGLEKVQAPAEGAPAARGARFKPPASAAPEAPAPSPSGSGRPPAP